MTALRRLIVGLCVCRVSSDLCAFQMVRALRMGPSSDTASRCLPVQSCPRRWSGQVTLPSCACGLSSRLSFLNKSFTVTRAAK